MEKFVGIVGFDNYMVSDIGNIKNKKTGRILKQSFTENGYLKVNISDGVKSHTRRVHVLVCEHFNPNPEHLPEVDHKDCVKTNNEADNLRWCTAQQNKDWYNEKYRIYKIRKKTTPASELYKPVCVNGVDYESAGKAAGMIAFETGKNRATISKEIRRMISGKRKFGTMYDKYEISSILSASWLKEM